MTIPMKSIVRWLVALAIPTAIVWAWLYSQQEAERQYKEFQQQKKNQPDQKETTVDNYQLKEVGDDNKVRWQLVAKRGIFETDTKDVSLSDVTVEYFDKDKMKMRISAPTGRANQDTKLVKLNSNEKTPVVAEGEEGKAKLEAKAVELTKKNQFVATGGVNILWPGVAKVTGDKASGVLGKDAQLKDIKIVGNTHSLLGKM